MSSNSARLLKFTYGLAGFALLVLATLFATSFWLFERNRATAEDLVLAREQRGKLFRLLISIQDAETGQRGYLLTGQPDYLKPYQDAMKSVDERLEALHTGFDKSETEEVDKLVGEKLSELGQTIRLREAGKADEALAIVRSDRGRELMTDLRTRIQSMVDKADLVLSRSVEEQGRIAARTRTFTVFSALLILAAALGAIYTILRYTRELVATRAELELANTGLEARVKARTADLQRANDEIQRFAYIVSHDLRSPLVNIMGFTSELEAGLGSLKSLSDNPALTTLEGGSEGKRAIDVDIPESLDFIRRSTGKMDGLIKAILKLSREGQRVLVPERIDTTELFQSLAAGVQHRLTELGGKIEIGRPLTSLVSDRLALEQIFGNLIDNAMKYRRPGVAPHIIVREEAGQSGTVVIAVKDNGRGIAADDQQRIFDLFRRAGVQDQPGEGIGLAHVRALVRRLEGDITVESEAGNGSTFRVLLKQRI